MMRYGFGVPTGTEGLMYPVPYADIDRAVELGLLAEQLGFESVWANDHVSTQEYVRAEFDRPPRFYDPMTYLAYLAAETTHIRLATAVMVLPFRHPVTAAKQAATLDLLSNGRLVLGVGVGAYREELEAMMPDRKIHRGEYVGEFLEALTILFSERRASFRGRWIEFRDVESFPKPLQDPLPILSGGNSRGSKSRAAGVGGWLPAVLSPAEARAGFAEISHHAAKTGRELGPLFEVALQLVVSVDRTHERAAQRFENSQVFKHLKSLSSSTLKKQHAGDLMQRNLIGTPEEIRERVADYQAAGVNTLAGLLFATNDVEETEEQMRWFAEEVIRNRA